MSSMQTLKMMIEDLLKAILLSSFAFALFILVFFYTLSKIVGGGSI